ncbi:hypothetical protein [uncultured Azohydromonas sp.]|jgi:hypothetical protein|uniref:hypothetical protein n=1 Tax=uncultured Azohydromonas sp. TaxID=487342 RepID=UPI00261B2201|nr:hypothetical protein [uncultured Azohydromonas sp.]
MRVEGSRPETLLAQLASEQQLLGGAKEGHRNSGGGVRHAQAVAPAQAQSALSVHLSTAGQAMANVVGSAGLTATARTQASSYAMDIGAGGNGMLPLPQLHTVQSIVEQVTGKRVGVFNAIDLGPMALIGGSAALVSELTEAGLQFAPGSQLMRYASSGAVTTSDGLRVGFSVVVTLVGRPPEVHSVDVSVNRVEGGASEPEPQPELKPKLEPEAVHAGPASDLLGHGLRFDLGMAVANGTGRPQMIGSGMVVFEKTASKAFTVEDVKAALRTIRVI